MKHRVHIFPRSKTLEPTFQKSCLHSAKSSSAPPGDRRPDSQNILRQS